jgi:Holliday junction resolvase RusA-like endonuclease
LDAEYWRLFHELEKANGLAVKQAQRLAQMVEDHAVTRIVEFTVHGKPGTAGSKKAFVYYKEGKPRAALTADNKRQKPFMAAVAAAAATACKGDPWLHEALRLEILIVRARPHSHYRTGANANLVRKGAPDSPTTKPDSLKICRAIEDAMSGVLYRDDSQICCHSIIKRYGTSDLVRVKVSEWLGCWDAT